MRSEAMHLEVFEVGPIFKKQFTRRLALQGDRNAEKSH
jgi:hypothetical protein